MIRAVQAFAGADSLWHCLFQVGFGIQRYLWDMAPMSWLDVGIVASSLAETKVRTKGSVFYGLSDQMCWFVRRVLAK